MIPEWVYLVTWFLDEIAQPVSLISLIVIWFIDRRRK